MSHFYTLVIAENEDSVSDLLARYSEHLEVEPYIRRTKAEMIADAKTCRQNVLNHIVEKNKTVLDEWEQEYFDAETDEELYKLASRHADLDEDGNELSSYNPDSKWDWWVIGGRWSGSISTKDGKNVNECQVKDVSLEPDKKVYKKALRFYEVVVDGKPLRKNEKAEDFETFYNPDYLRQHYQGKENYAKCMASPAPFALVTSDGVWHQKGKMGWFGMNDTSTASELEWPTEVERLITESDQELHAFVVDCHI